MDSFIIHGSSVTYKNGAAHFSKYKLAITVPHRHFTLSWCIKMDVRLSQIVKMFGSFTQE